MFFLYNTSNNCCNNHLTENGLLCISHGVIKYISKIHFSPSFSQNFHIFILHITNLKYIIKETWEIFYHADLNSISILNKKVLKKMIKFLSIVSKFDSWTISNGVDYIKFAEPVRHFASMVQPILVGYNLKIICY